MVYHEQRKINGKDQNYLIHNKRDKDSGKWIKKSKYIGDKKISKEKLEELKKDFEIELKSNTKYKYLTKAQIKEIEKIKNEYIKKLKELESEEFEIFERTFFTELTYNSNAIEGNTLSLEDTDLILNENLVPEGKTVREIFEAKNHKKALEFIKNYNGNIDEQLILKIHKIILENISQRFAGRYREGNVRIFGSNVKFPSSNKVPQEIKNLIYWYKENKKDMHPFELAVIFSMKLVTIHPFVDGNGRVSRLIMNFLLKKKNYPWINVYNKNRADYLKAVRKANDEEYEEIVNFLLKSLKQNLKDFEMK